MIALLQRKSFKVLHPLLRRVVSSYLKKPRKYRHKDISVIVHPSVFHPGFFYSTKFLLSFLAVKNLSGKRMLELGAGSGLISIFCTRRGAKVTASDISDIAIKGLKQNAERNQCEIEVVKSDLFENILASDFDVIVINPPYYPKAVTDVKDVAWFCGEDFEYFARLFEQLSRADVSSTQIWMILSEDCQIKKIRSIADKNALSLEVVEEKRIGGELNWIFEIKRSSAQS